MLATPSLAVPEWPVFRTPSGVTIAYPPDWRVAMDRSGLIAIAGPRASWGRPVATVTVLRSGGQPETTVDRAARNVGDPANLRLLGTQHLGPDRLAKYYVRSDPTSGRPAAYVMIGSAEGKVAAVVIVAVDSVRDPDLRVRADVFQAFLLRLTVP